MKVREAHGKSMCSTRNKELSEKARGNIKSPCEIRLIRG